VPVVPDSEFAAVFAVGVRWSGDYFFQKKQYKCLSTRGRCYPNFLRFLPIFGEKNGVFLKNQCYDQIFAQLRFVSSKKRQFFANFIGENILKSIVSVLGNIQSVTFIYICRSSF
jgi:hypothetical protein